MPHPHPPKVADVVDLVPESVAPAPPRRSRPNGPDAAAPTPPPLDRPAADGYGVAVAVAGAWAVLLIVNLFWFTPASFAHLDDWQPGTALDYGRWGAAGVGSSRPLVTPGEPIRFALLDRLLVTNQPAEDFLAATARIGYLDAGKLSELYDELATAQARGGCPLPPSPPRGVKWLWFGNATEPLDAFVSPAGHFKMLARTWHSATLRVGNSDELTRRVVELHAKLAAHDPSVPLGGLKDEYGRLAAAIHDDLQRKHSGRGETFAAFLARYRPLAPPVPPDGSPAVGTNVLSVLYFPPPLPGRSDGPSARQYAFALEIDQRGGFADGWSLRARYLLFDLGGMALNQAPLRAPLFSPQRPSVEVIARSHGWFGLRPTKVLVSEEQLAARFFGELDGIARGCGETASLKPDQKVADQYQRAIHRVLLERLGQLGASDPTAGEHWPVRPMGEWIVWPRRVNGGTWWGLIQFAVLAAVVGFIREGWTSGRTLARLRAVLLPPARTGLIRRAVIALAGRLGWRTATGPPEPEEQRLLDIVGDTGRPAAERQEAVAALRGRMDRSLAAARLIAGLLPLVGFLGSVAGLSNSLVESAGVSSPDPLLRQSSLVAMQVALGTAFDKSILAFAGSIFCLAGLHRLNGRADEVEAAVRDRLLTT